MNTIPLQRLAPGSAMAFGLFHESGEMLLAPGTTLQERHLETLRSLGVVQTYVPASSADDVNRFVFDGRHKQVDLSDLRGLRAIPFDLYDSNEALLASCGVPVTSESLRLLEEYAEGGIFRKKTRRERNLGQAESFHGEFPIPETRPVSDSKYLALDTSRPSRETAVLQGVRRVAKKRILVVEDEVNLRRILVAFLREAGFEVGEAADGEQGLSMAMSGDWNLLLLDVMMPKLDGFAVCQRLKARTDRVPPKVILCTARNSREDVLTGLQAGADDYIVKPFRRQTVLDKVAKTLTKVQIAPDAGPDRRRAPRYPVQISMTWTLLDEWEPRLEARARVRDLSIVGLSFEYPVGEDTPPAGEDGPAIRPAHPLFRFANANSRGRDIRMLVELLPSAFVDLSGRITRIQPRESADIVGVEFGTLRPEAHATLVDFIADHCNRQG